MARYRALHGNILGKQRGILMEVISNALDRAVNMAMTMSVTDAVDILIVAFFIYQAIQFIRKTSSYNLAKGIILVFVVLLLSELLQLTMMSYLIRNLMELGLIALLILFQPELRRLLERMGSSLTDRRQGASPAMETAIAQTVLACTDMSASKTGALIIFERNVKLNTIMSTGTIINSDVTAELIKNMFFNKAPLHDGALIIRDTRIAAAGCVLPLTQSTNLSKDLGMRHRAGIGLSEQSDAVVIIVSEETGYISVAIEGMLKRHLTAATLDKLLHNELVLEDEDRSGRGILGGLKKVFKGNGNEKNKPDKKNI